MFNRLNLSLTLNKKCQLCQHNLALSGLQICSQCFKDLPITHHRFIKSDIDPLNTEITAVCHYAHPINDLILAYKNQHQLQLANVIVELFLTLPKPDKNSLLVPMPTSPSRMRQRGFDHMHLITKKLAKKWQLPIWHGIKRHDGDRQQKGLNRVERITNMVNQFYLTTLPPTGKQLIIIDDVCTTGSSIASLAHCLSESQLKTQAYVLAYKLG